MTSAPARLLVGLVASVTILWSTAAGAVSVLPGSTFTSSSGQVEYEIFANVGFGASATLPAGSHGFDLIPDLALFAAFGPTVVGGSFDFEAIGVEFGPLTTVINQATARRYFQGDPLGQRLRIGQNGPWREVVGLVRDVQNLGPEKDPQPELFLNIRQLETASRQLFLVVNSSDPSSIGPSLTSTAPITR